MDTKFDEWVHTKYGLLCYNNKYSGQCVEENDNWKDYGQIYINSSSVNNGYILFTIIDREYSTLKGEQVFRIKALGIFNNYIELKSGKYY